MIAVFAFIVGMTAGFVSAVYLMEELYE